MKSMNRLMLYPHKEPNGRAFVLGDKKGLRDFAKKLEQAANGFVGLETITLYGADGHPYELMIVSDISETEWQQINENKKPASLDSVQLYDSLKETL